MGYGSLVGAYPRWGGPVSGELSRFADVDGSLWWAPYVERLADLGVTGGCATFLRTTNAEYDWSDDLYLFMIRHDARPELLQAFKNVIVHQADNGDFFEWEVEANGMLMSQD